MIYVHDSVADELVKRLAQRIDGLIVGLPWGKNVSITPLAEPGKPKYLQEVIADALAKGAAVANATGVRIREFPITLDKLLPRLRAA